MNSTNCFGCTRPQPPLLEALEARVLLSLCDGPPLYEGISAAVQLGEQVATSVRRCPAFELAISQGRLVRSEDQPGVLLAPPGIAYEDIWSLVQHNINAADTTNTDQLWSGGGLADFRGHNTIFRLTASPAEVRFGHGTARTRRRSGISAPRHPAGQPPAAHVLLR